MEKNWRMRAFGLFLFLVFIAASWPAIGISCETRASLFSIERSKNRNFVQYDVCLDENGDLRNSNPVNVYWVLESGENEELNAIEKRYGYGIKSQEKLEKNKFGVYLVAVKDRKITVEKIGDRFMAIVSIDGKPCILERIFIRTEEKKIGMPKVLYVDLFGRTKYRSVPVKERISLT